MVLDGLLALTDPWGPGRLKIIFSLLGSRGLISLRMNPWAGILIYLIYTLLVPFKVP